MNEPSSTVAAEFVPGLLDELEKLQQRPNVFLLEMLIDAALLAGAAQLFEESWASCCELPDSALVAGAITNISIEQLSATRLKPTKDTAEQRRPLYDRGEIERLLQAGARTERHIALALAGEWDEAYSAADGVPRALEDVAATQALLGDPDEALARIARSVPGDHRAGPLSALAVESARRGELARARETMRCIENDSWMLTYVAFGWLGRQPWPGYPLADW